MMIPHSDVSSTLLKILTNSFHLSIKGIADSKIEEPSRILAQEESLLWVTWEVHEE